MKESGLFDSTNGPWPRHTSHNFHLVRVHSLILMSLCDRKLGIREKTCTHS